MYLPKQDIIIVGAGPAGATLGLLLARSGVRVCIIEQNTVLERSFRGPGFTPSSLRFWDQLGVLEKIRANKLGDLPAIDVSKFGKPLISINFSKTSPEYPTGYALEHQPLLEILIRESLSYPNFTYLGAHAASSLIMSDGKIEGVIASHGKTEHPLHARLVIACDGRFSAIRKAAGIELARTQAAFDILWFPIRLPEGFKLNVRTEAEAGGQSIVIPRRKGHALVGLVIQKGSYNDIKKAGIEAFKKRMIASTTSIAEFVNEQIYSFSQLHYLDVKIARARQWVRDGLLLIGDAAHIVSPVGSQGNNLAIQDAVCAHPYIMEALKQTSGTIMAKSLTAYVKHRKPQIWQIQRVQEMIFKALQTDKPLMLKLQFMLIPKLIDSALGIKIQQKLVIGFPDIQVQKKWFIDTQDEKYRQSIYHKLKIVELKDETQDTKTIRLEIPNDLNNLFGYRAGQFVTLRLLVEGQVVTRCYSISNAPSDNNTLSITVKKVAGGLVSNALHDSLEVGQELNVAAPAGSFVLPKQHPEACNYIMIAGGSGITPIISLLQNILEEHAPAKVHLIDANSNQNTIIFKQHIAALQQKYPQNLDVKHVLSSKSGRLSVERLGELLDKIPYATENNTHFYICGPQGLKDIASQSLAAINTQQKRIHQENFTTAPPSSDAKAIEENHTHVIAPYSQPGTPESLSVSLNGQLTKIKPLENETILEAAIRSGVNPPYSCMSGICGSCRAKLNEGEVHMENASGLSSEELQEHNILTCQAIPKSKNVAVDYS